MIGASENFMLLNLNLGAVGDTRLLRCNILIFPCAFATEETVPATEIRRQVAMHCHTRTPTM